MIELPNCRYYCKPNPIDCVKTNLKCDLLDSNINVKVHGILTHSPEAGWCLKHPVRKGTIRRLTPEELTQYDLNGDPKPQYFIPFKTVLKVPLNI